MKLTSYIKNAILNGYGSEYIRMLENYGRWSRYFGAVGYVSAHTHESYDIDDDSALILDRAFQSLKDDNFRAFKFLEMFYSRGWDEGDILSIVRTRRGAKQLNLSRDETVLIMKAKEHHITKLIVKAEKLLFEILVAMEDK